jgi:PAS domain S-box-containing protein
MGRMLPHAIVISDREGRIHVWSPGAEQLFGWSAAEAVGQSLDLIVPESARERHWKAFHEAMRTGVPKIHDVGTELPALCKDGQKKKLPARFLFLRDAGGSPVGAMALFSPPKD